MASAPPGVCVCVCATATEKSGDDADLSDKGNPGRELSKKAVAFLSFRVFFFFFLNQTRRNTCSFSSTGTSSPHRTAFLPSTSEPRRCSRRLPQFGELFIPLLKWSRSFSPLHASWIISEYVLSLTTNFSLLEKEKRKRHKHFSVFRVSRWTLHPPTKKSLNLSRWNFHLLTWLLSIGTD